MLVIHHLKGIIPDRSLQSYRKEYLSLPEPEKRQDADILGKKDTEESSNVVNIPTNYEVKDAVSSPQEPIDESYNVTTEILNEEKEKTEEPGIIYDKDLLNKHVKEIAKLQEEIAKLKIDRIPTRANQFKFEYNVEFNDEMFHLIKANSGICPFICTIFPDKGDGYIRFDQIMIEQLIKKEARKKK